MQTAGQSYGSKALRGTAKCWPYAEGEGAGRRGKPSGLEKVKSILGFGDRSENGKEAGSAARENNGNRTHSTATVDIPKESGEHLEDAEAARKDLCEHTHTHDTTHAATSSEVALACGGKSGRPIEREAETEPCGRVRKGRPAARAPGKDLRSCTLSALVERKVTPPRRPRKNQRARLEPCGSGKIRSTREEQSDDADRGTPVGARNKRGASAPRGARARRSNRQTAALTANSHRQRNPRGITSAIRRSRSLNANTPCRIATRTTREIGSARANAIFEHQETRRRPTELRVEPSSPTPTALAAGASVTLALVGRPKQDRTLECAEAIRYADAGCAGPPGRTAYTIDMKCSSRAKSSLGALREPHRLSISTATSEVSTAIPDAQLARRPDSCRLRTRSKA